MGWFLLSYGGHEQRTLLPLHSFTLNTATAVTCEHCDDPATAYEHHTEGSGGPGFELAMTTNADKPTRISGAAMTGWLSW